MVCASLQGSDYGIPRKKVVVAIGEGKNTQYAVEWAVNHLVDEDDRCVFVHVAPPGRLNDDDSGRKNTARPATVIKAHQHFLPYRDLCAQKGIKPDEVILEGNQVSSALLDYISTNDVSNVVVGASSRYAITRKFRNNKVATYLATEVPASCTVHIIAKGKVLSQQPANHLRVASNAVMPLKQLLADNPDSYKVDNCSSWSSTRPFASSEYIDYEDSLINCECPSEKGDQSICTIGSSHPPESQSNSTVSMPSDGTYDGVTPGVKTSMENVDFSFYTRSTSYHLDTSSCSSVSFGKVSYETVDVSPLVGGIHLKPTDSCSSSSSNPPHNTESEMKLALKQTNENYESACEEATIISQAAAIDQCREKKVEDPLLALKEQAAEKIAALAKLEVERQIREIANEKARKAQEQYETSEKTAKVKTARNGVERKTILDENPEYLAGCKRYSIDEIEVATDHFSESLRIGEGGYGPVFKGILDEVDVAIKIRRPDISQGQKQFDKEVDVLNRVKHPNIIRLIGACPEYGCLVYEYVEEGSLEDQLFRKDGTPPIPWKSRFRIANEISIALLFLHQAKPDPLVHRDLKPANILLDHNYAAKISDVGLARLLPAPGADNTSNYQITDAAGTFCYIDPEYQQTGLLGVKSDVYSLGIILLQIITAKPPMGLTHLVQGAIESGSLSEILDPSVSDWPLEETLSFAKLALKCCELSKKDRPDLCSVIVPALNQISGIQLERLSSLPSDSCQFLPGKPVRIQRTNAKGMWRKFRNRWSLLAACSGNTKRHSVVANAEDMDFIGCWSCTFSNRHLIRADLEKMPSHENHLKTWL